MITLGGDVRIFLDSANVPCHVEDNVSECTDNEDNNAIEGVASEKEVENNAVQGVTPENRKALKPKRNLFVKFQSVEGSEWQHATIISV